MKRLQQINISLEKGKEVKKENVGEARSYMDSIADTLLDTAKTDLKKAIEKKNPLEVVSVYEVVEQEIQLEKMTKPQLIKYALDNEITIDDKANKPDILNSIIEATKTD